MMKQVITQEITDTLVFSTEKKAKAFTKIIMAIMYDVENGIIRNPDVFIKGMRDINDGINRRLYDENSKIRYTLTDSNNKKIILNGNTRD